MSYLKNFWLFFIWFGAIIYLSFTPLSGWPKSNIFDKLYFDKIVHISMYAILCFLLLRGILKQQSHPGLRYSLSAVAVLFSGGAGIVIEILQPMITSFRQFELFDLVANSAGAILGYLFFAWFLKKRWLGLKWQAV